MPTTGKSTIGKRLADKLDMYFVDTDDLIEIKQGMTLSRILSSFGSEGFLSIEEDVIMNHKFSEQVIATGGSVALNPKIMEYLRSISTVVFMDTSIKTLGQRLGKNHLAKVVGAKDMTLKELEQHRRPYYEKYADTTVFMKPYQSKDKAAQQLAAKLEGLISLH